MKKHLFICFILILFLWSCKSKEDQPVKSAEPYPQAEVKTEVATKAPEEAKTSINHPPFIKILTVTPKYPQKGDTLALEPVAEDQDGDIVTFTYEWSKNGEPLSVTSNTMTLKGDFERGDKVTVKVFPYDGKEKGSPAFSIITIDNSPPAILSSPSPMNLENRQYTYQMKAGDPDGDILTYSLKSAPDGMTIDPSKGLIRWNVPKEFKGKAQFTVAVNDGHGGEVLLSLAIEITSERR